MSSLNSIIGRSPGASAVLKVDYGEGITHVDELIRPPGDADFLSPGFIDLQVNGFAGVDYNDPEAKPEGIGQSIQKMFETGVTRFFPTIITGSEDRMLGAMRNLASAKTEFLRHGMAEGHAMEGLHIEGPHISGEDGPRGAHPVEHVRPPDVNEFHRWQEAADGQIRLITVSPEWEQTPAYIREIVRSGVVASIGHTKATSEQIAAAVDAGATMSTHLGNAAHPALPKTQNYIWDQLAEDRLTASFITDGIHIPGSFFRSAVRAKGVERSVLVTDAVMPAMCLPGPYRLGGIDVQLLDNGSVVLRGGNRLAGSALRMDHAISYAVRLGRLSLREALSMATVNPARVGRIAGRQRGLSPGEKADFVRFQWTESPTSLEVIETIVAGQRTYLRA
ncbi:MAG: amidohydrolase family protein [Acidobacteriaceae bacterium]|nr:amidohydrolase family protein [Acidobacteriaceae bacterium]